MALGRIALVSIKGMVREVEREILGVMSISLEKAIQNGLFELKAYGGTEQTGTPIPTTPVDIVTNNGVLKFSKNMANVNTQTILLGYYISSSGVVTADTNNRIYQDYIPCKPNTTYTLSLSSSVYYVTISEYSTAEDSGFVRRNAGSSGYNTQLTVTTDATTNYLRFGTNIDRTEITLEEVLAINWQLERGDTPTPYHEYVEGGIYTDGTTETISSTLSTATAEMLLKVGDYVDEQEILSGDITRKIGIKVLDGTEDWTASGNLFYAGIATDALEDTHSCYCTHFKGVATNASASYDNEIKVGTNATQTVNWTRVQIYPVVGTYSNVTALKQWLTDQYNAGTPVIVVYPLKTPTTETVTGQTMNIQAGNNTIDITQASLNTLELSAKYKALPN